MTIRWGSQLPRGLKGWTRHPLSSRGGRLAKTSARAPRRPSLSLTKFSRKCLTCHCGRPAKPLEVSFFQDKSAILFSPQDAELCLTEPMRCVMPAAYSSSLLCLLPPTPACVAIMTSVYSHWASLPLFCSMRHGHEEGMSRPFLVAVVF